MKYSLSIIKKKKREREGGRGKERELKSNSAHYFCHVMKKRKESEA